MYSKGVIQFLELMGTRLRYIGLAEILELYSRFHEASKLPKAEREPILKSIKHLDIMEGSR